MKILMVAYDNDSYITWFPQGLAYLASAARNAGHEIEVYQQDIFHWPDSHLTEYLDQHDFDVVEVSVIGGYYQYRKLMALSEAINASKKRGGAEIYDWRARTGRGSGILFAENRSGCCWNWRR